MAGMLEISSPSMRADRETAVRAAPFFAVAMDALTGLVSADAAGPRKMQPQVAVGARLGANAIPLQSDAVDQRDTETESTVSVGAGPDGGVRDRTFRALVAEEGPAEGLSPAEGLLPGEGLSPGEGHGRA